MWVVCVDMHVFVDYMCFIADYSRAPEKCIDTSDSVYTILYTQHNTLPCIECSLARAYGRRRMHI